MTNSFESLKDIYIVGNGKSLKDFDFEFLRDKEWIGMCLAYRHWETIDLYPSHYVCVDSVILKNNIEDIKKLIIEKKCKTFLLCASIIDQWKEILNFKNVVFIQEFVLTNENPFRYLVDYCTGTSAVLYGYCLGLENIPECKKLEDGTLQITETPEINPNYYFDSYQREGDIYNKPNKDRVHKSSWHDLRNIIILYNILRQKQINMFDYSPSKEIQIFEKKSLDILK